MSEQNKSIKYNYSVELNNHILFLIYLSHIYKLDLEMLLLLYDKIGDDVFFMFFMFAGKSLIMPKHTKMIKIRNFVDLVMNGVSKGAEVDCSTQQEKSFLSFVKSFYNQDTNSISIQFEIPVVCEEPIGNE